MSSNRTSSNPASRIPDTRPRLACSDQLRECRRSGMMAGCSLSAQTGATVLWDLARGTELALLPIGDMPRLLFDRSGDLLTNGLNGVRRWPIQLDVDRDLFAIGPPRELRLPAGGCEIAEDRSGRFVAKADYDEVYVTTPRGEICIGALDECRTSRRLRQTGTGLRRAPMRRGRVRQIWQIPDFTRVADLARTYHGGLVQPGRPLAGDGICRRRALGGWDLSLRCGNSAAPQPAFARRPTVGCSRGKQDPARGGRHRPNAVPTSKAPTAGGRMTFSPDPGAVGGRHQRRSRRARLGPVDDPQTPG